MNLTKKEFQDLKNLKKEFLLFMDINSDELTPVGVFQKLNYSNKALLESMENHNVRSRHSIIAIDPYKRVYGYGRSLSAVTSGKVENIEIDPISYFKNDIGKVISSELPFIGGAIGYFGYDIKKIYENIGSDKYDPIRVPDYYFMYYKKYIVFDHLTDTIHIGKTIMEDDDSSYEKCLDELNQIKNQVIMEKGITPIKDQREIIFESNTSEDEFKSMVSKAKEYIESGDIFQVVLSQRFSANISGNDFFLYRKLRRSNPSPYMFYIEFDDFKILGSSPESLVKVEDRYITTNPIAGTRKRGRSDEEDRDIIGDLLSDEKERAEHLMLVDLGRNDIGAVSKISSVKVESYLKPEKFSSVIHLTAKVSGLLEDNLHPLDGFSSVFPAGTLSGAPKIRAMEIINELEKEKRGVYGGAIGYMSFNGNIDFAIAIRCGLVKDGVIYIQSGAGVVYDSVEEKEYEETKNKALSVMEVLR
ncbi:MAG: anthranilate synthase component I [Clostridium sp.]